MSKVEGKWMTYEQNGTFGGMHAARNSRHNDDIMMMLLVRALSELNVLCQTTQERKKKPNEGQRFNKQSVEVHNHHRIASNLDRTQLSSVVSLLGARFLTGLTTFEIPHQAFSRACSLLDCVCSLSCLPTCH